MKNISLYFCFLFPGSPLRKPKKPGMLGTFTKIAFRIPGKLIWNKAAHKA